MKYNHLLMLSTIIPVILSTMEIKRTSSVTKEATKAALTKLIYREKTVITVTNQPDSHDTSIESIDQDVELGIDNTKETNKDNPKKNKLTKQLSYVRQ